MARLRGIPISLTLVLLAAPLARAAGAEHDLDWWNLFWRVLNFLLVAGVIWYLAGKKIIAFFRGRRSSIEQELHDLEARKEAARQELQDVEQRIASLDREREAILEEYRARGEAVKQEIIAAAEERARIITAQAQQGAQNEIDQALTAMRADLAEAIAEATQKALAESLTPKQHEALIDAFVTKVVLQ